VSPKLALSNLPERNPFFTGRERVLTELQKALAARGRAALSGLGGVGKTQTAVEYAHRHLAEYAHAFWANADSREALVHDFVTIAGLLKLPESDAQNQKRAVDAVKRWLGSKQGWLLILDNADDIVIARATAAQVTLFFFWACISGGSRFLASQSFACCKSHA
jgi:predicted ATPase